LGRGAEREHYRRRAPGRPSKVLDYGACWNDPSVPTKQDSIAVKIRKTVGEGRKFPEQSRPGKRAAIRPLTSERQGGGTRYTTNKTEGLPWFAGTLRGLPAKICHHWSRGPHAGSSPSGETRLRTANLASLLSRLRHKQERRAQHGRRPPAVGTATKLIKQKTSLDEDPR